MAYRPDTTNPPAVSPPVSEVDRLRAELAQWPKFGVIEVMVRNPSVSDYVGEMEAEIERLRNALRMWLTPSGEPFNVNAAIAETERVLGDAPRPALKDSPHG